MYQSNGVQSRIAAMQCASFGSIQSRMLQCASVVSSVEFTRACCNALQYSEVRLRLLRYASVRGTEMVGAFANVICHLDRTLDPVQRSKSNKLAQCT